MPILQVIYSSFALSTGMLSRFVYPFLHEVVSCFACFEGYFSCFAFSFPNIFVVVVLAFQTGTLTCSALTSVFALSADNIIFVLYRQSLWFLFCPFCQY